MKPTAEINRIIAEKAATYAVDPLLVHALIQVESSYRPDAKRDEPRLNDASYGLMQVLSGTARSMLGFAGDAEALLDPSTNVDLGVRYLKYQLGRYAGDVPSALAAYNAGTASRRSDGKFINQGYVDKVYKLYQALQARTGQVVVARTTERGVFLPPDWLKDSAFPLRFQAGRGDERIQLETFIPAAPVPWVVAGATFLGLTLLLGQGAGKRRSS